MIENKAPIPVSVEEFAAFLDGNLSLEDTQNMAALISSNSTLSELISVNSEIDIQMQQMLDSGFSLPDSLSDSEFVHPNLDVIENASDIAAMTELLNPEQFINNFSGTYETNAPETTSHHENELFNDSLNQGYHSPSDITSIDEQGLHVDLFDN